jgi:hypothetical protein
MQILFSKPTEATTSKFGNVWNKCTVESGLEMKWYIVHESSPEMVECDAFKQEVSLVIDAISTQPAKCPDHVASRSMPSQQRRGGWNQCAIGSARWCTCRPFVTLNGGQEQVQWDG